MGEQLLFFVIPVLVLLGLVGLLVSTYQMWAGTQRSWGTFGLLMGWLPPIQWLWVVEAPRRRIGLLGRQLLGLTLCGPGLALGAILYSLSHMKIG